MEAPSSIQCPDCRARWTRTHDEAGRAKTYTPIGYAVIYKITQDEEKYFATARSYTDLRNLVGNMEPGTRFTIRLCAFLEIVGNGEYLKTDEGLQVLAEDDFCEGLFLAMTEAEQ